VNDAAPLRDARAPGTSAPITMCFQSRDCPAHWLVRQQSHQQRETAGYHSHCSPSVRGRIEPKTRHTVLVSAFEFQHEGAARMLPRTCETRP
jgi:hypothetical protein